MNHDYVIDGLAIKTGDILCTTDGGSGVPAGQVWRLIGRLIPGVIDHVAIYVGPEGRCVEAAAKLKVVTFKVRENHWDAERMKRQRGPIIDKLHGVASPLHGKALSAKEEESARTTVATYCLRQAELAKPYNLDFPNSTTEDAFYCSQLAYQAYLMVGIDLNTGRGVPNIPGTAGIIFPQEIWAGCWHKRVPGS
jgi:hypothetical protein